MTLRKTTELEKKAFLYLNKLRKSGKTNMYGARPFVMRQFSLDADEAKVLLTTWMRVFNAEGKYDEIDTGD